MNSNPKDNQHILLLVGCVFQTFETYRINGVLLHMESQAYRKHIIHLKASYNMEYFFSGYFSTLNFLLKKKALRKTVRLTLTNIPSPLQYQILRYYKHIKHLRIVSEAPKYPSTFRMNFPALNHLTLRIESVSITFPIYYP